MGLTTKLLVYLPVDLRHILSRVLNEFFEFHQKYKMIKFTSPLLSRDSNGTPSAPYDEMLSLIICRDNVKLKSNLFSKQKPAVSQLQG